MSSGDPHRSSEQLQQICGEIAAAVRNKWGRGPRRTTARWVAPDTLVALMADGATHAEATLRAAGHAERVASGRRMLLQMIEDELRAIVGAATGREVITVLCATRLDPDLSVAVFLLGGQGGRQLEDPETAWEHSLVIQQESRALRSEARQARRRRSELRQGEPADSPR
jgi:uncharacterized protein YbcI